MAMSKRDTQIAYWTLGLIGIYVLYALGVKPILDQWVQLKEDVQQESDQYDKNQALLARAKSIEAGYKRVEAQFPPDVPDKDPADLFSEEVNSIVTTLLGRTPDIQPPDQQDIKGAKGYQMLSLSIRVKGELEPLAKLFMSFDQKGYLVQALSAQRDANLDKKDITAELTLSRIVKPPSEDELPAAGPRRPGGIRLPGRVR
jgi:hypothetical protein